MSENLSKLTSSRVSYQSHLTKILQKAKDFMAKEQPTKMDLVSLENIVEQLARKKLILIGLDEKIVALIGEPDNIEQEIFESEEIQDQIQETSWQISKFMKLSISTEKPSFSRQESPQVATHELEPGQNTLSEPYVIGTQGTSSLSNQVDTPETPASETTPPNPQFPQVMQNFSTPQTDPHSCNDKS